jgi:hypothetical protein
MRKRPLVLLALPAVALMASGVAAPLGGSHAFRQAHVAANIEIFVRDGLSLRPSTYNEDTSFSPAFDFPLYQLVVAAICRLAPAEPLRAARVVNLAFFVAALVVLDRLLVQAGIRRWPRAGALGFFAYAPLALFYFQAPIVDGLALLLALLSLQQYVSLEAGGVPTRARLVLLLSAFLSTLIKSPVYLPVLLAILWHRARRRGVRTLVRGDGAALLAAAGLALLCFKLYWMTANGASQPLTSWERQHYFGTLAERFHPAAWRPVIGDLVLLTSNPVVVVLAAGGALYWTRRARAPVAPVFTGLLLGGAITLLVFFHLYRPHNYYQLPLVFPIAFFGAQGLEGLRLLARAGRRSGRPVWPAARVAVPILVLAAGVWGWAAFGRLAVSSEAIEVLRSRGEWIRERTNADDYVIYTFPANGEADPWNPLYLYYAKRRGYDLPSGEVTPARLAAIRAQARDRFTRVLAFSVREETHRVLAGIAGEPLASMGRRALFQLDPVRPGAPPGTLRQD